MFDMEFLNGDFSAESLTALQEIFTEANNKPLQEEKISELKTKLVKVTLDEVFRGLEALERSPSGDVFLIVTSR